MISQNINIITDEDLKKLTQKQYSRGVERGKFEVDHKPHEDAARQKAFNDAIQWFLKRKTQSFSGTMVISALKSIAAFNEAAP